MSCQGNVAAYLLEGKDAGAVALSMLQRDYSYGEVRSAAGQMARRLAASGEKGDRVVLIAENSLFWVAAYLGTLAAGQVCVPLPKNVSKEDLAYIVELTGATTACVQVRCLAGREALLEGVDVVTEKDLVGEGLPGGFSAMEAGDLAAIMFTSGSTGQPRGVMVSHGNIRANTESIIAYLGLTARDRMMTVLPFHYCFGTSLLHTHLRVGGSLVIDSRFLYPEAVLQRMAETECTGFAGVPSHFQILLRRSTLKKRSFPHLRYVQQAGGHLAPVFIRELRAALPETKVYVMYGQTEATARLSYVPPEWLDAKTGSIGKGMAGVYLQVVDGAGNRVATGEVGEIVATGDNVTQGYWRAPEESRSCFRDGRLYTGDLATVDEDGFIYVVDRAKDFLKCGGERVSCRQVEERLLEHEELLEAAVVGVPDDVRGEAVRAFVVLRAPECKGPCRWPECRGVRERLLRHCRERLPVKLAPREMVVMAALPKNGAGKVVKAGLRGL